MIEQWIEDGLAHVAFKGRAVCYDGGETGPLTEQEWWHRYCAGTRHEPRH
jgi:hypothetical protein